MYINFIITGNLIYTNRTQVDTMYFKYVLVLLYKCNTGILQFKYIKSNRWISVKLLIIINFIFNPVILIINIFKIKNLVKYKH